MSSMKMEVRTGMSDDKTRVYCTIDHANKQGDRRNFNPHKLWLRQMKQRRAAQAAAEQDEELAPLRYTKGQLA